jgi:hypothetical protein
MILYSTGTDNYHLSRVGGQEERPSPVLPTSIYTPLPDILTLNGVFTLVTNRTKFQYDILKTKIDDYLKTSTGLNTPSHAAAYIGVTLKTLYNYRTDDSRYNNNTFGADIDFSYKTLVESLYTVLENRILDWMAEDPTKRTAAAALILNKHFGYRVDTNSNVNVSGTIKIELPPELQKLAR